MTLIPLAELFALWTPDPAILAGLFVFTLCAAAAIGLLTARPRAIGGMR